MKDTVPSRFQVVGRLARSNTTEVHLCRLQGVEGFQKELIVKRITAEHMRDPQLVVKFLEQARLAAGLSHPNIAQVFEVGESDGGPYVAMEYVRGVSLGLVGQRAQQARKVHYGHFAKLIARVCDALAYAQGAHQAEHGHTDIIPGFAFELSPASIVVTGEGIPKLIDLDAVGGRDSQRAVATNEVFAAGVMLFELTTGIHPFGPERHRASDALGRIARGAYARPSAVSMGYPRDLERIVLGAIDRRLASLRDLRDRLEEFAAAPAYRSNPSALAAWLRELFPDFSALTKTSGWSVASSSGTTTTLPGTTTLPAPMLVPPSAPVPLESTTPLSAPVPLARPSSMPAPAPTPVREFRGWETSDQLTPPVSASRPTPRRAARLKGVGPWTWVVLGTAAVGVVAGAAALVRTPDSGPSLARAPAARPGEQPLAPPPAPTAARTPAAPPASPAPAPVAKAQEEPAPAPAGSGEPAPAAGEEATEPQRASVKRPIAERTPVLRRPATTPAPTRRYALAAEPAPPPATVDTAARAQPPAAPVLAPPPPAASERPEPAPPPVPPTPAAPPPERPVASAGTSPGAPPPETRPANPGPGTPGGPTLSAMPKSPVPIPTLPRVLPNEDPERTVRVCQAVESAAVSLAGLTPEFVRGVTGPMRRGLRAHAPIYPIAMYYFIVREAGLRHDSAAAASNLAAAQANGFILRFKDFPGIEKDSP